MPRPRIWGVDELNDGKFNTPQNGDLKIGWLNGRLTIAVRENGAWTADYLVRAPQVGVAGGVAPLSSSSKLPIAHIPFGGGGGEVCEANDARLSNARTPVAHGHPQSDVTDLVLTLAGKAASSHSHAQADVTNLVTDLAGKAAASHGHAQSDVTGLVTALSARIAGAKLVTTADQTRTLTALADIPGLGFTAEANTDYGFVLFIIYQSAATNCGVSLTVNGPASPSGRAPVWDSGIQVTGGPSTTAMQHKAQVAADALHTTATVDTANTPRIARFHGTWPVGSTGGTITPRFASEVAGTEIKVLKGSWLLIF